MVIILEPCGAIEYAEAIRMDDVSSLIHLAASTDFVANKTQHLRVETHTNSSISLLLY